MLQPLQALEDHKHTSIRMSLDHGSLTQSNPNASRNLIRVGRVAQSV